MKRTVYMLASVAGAGLLAGTAAAQDAAPVVKDGVSCVATMMTARDGTKLHTEVYRPVDTADKPLPAIVSRSPYSAQLGEGCFSHQGLQGIAGKGYAAVYQSVRGTGSSEGLFTAFFQEQDDGVDLIAWIAKQPWSNGKVGLTQGSYLGVTQWQPAIKSPPHLVAFSPYVSTAEVRNNWVTQNGVYDIQFAKGWGQQFVNANTRRMMERQGATKEQIDAALKPADLGAASSPFPVINPANDRLREGGAFLWDWYRHPDYDAYWAKIDGLAQIGKVRAPALIGGGWYDLFEKGTIDSYVAMRTRAGTPAARRDTILIMDCCGHGMAQPDQPGKVNWGKNQIDYNWYRDRFMAWQMKGVANGMDREPKVHITVLVPPDSGTQGSNFVYGAADFPLPGTAYVRYNLISGGKANTRDGDGRLDMARQSSGAADSFEYDPKNPVPTRGGNSGSGAIDQAEVEKRQDVLVYTAPATDKTQAIIGKVSAHFWAATDGRDTDFTAKLVDVHPDGGTHNIVDRIVRARYRRGANLPPLLVRPNTPYEYDLDLGYTATMLKAGHRLRLQISSSSYPAYSPNLNTGASNEESTEARVARNTILHDAAHPSYVTIPVAPGVDLPGK